MEPKDRNGNVLAVGDTVQLFNFSTGLPIWKATVINFDPSPDYDRSTIGIFIDTQTGSVHPALIEKAEASP